MACIEKGGPADKSGDVQIGDQVQRCGFCCFGCFAYGAVVWVQRCNFGCRSDAVNVLGACAVLQDEPEHVVECHLPLFNLAGGLRR